LTVPTACSSRCGAAHPAQLLRLLTEANERLFLLPAGWTTTLRAPRLWMAMARLRACAAY
jgi:hypothetical protein